MRIGLGLDGSLRLAFDDLRDLGVEAVRLGFESLWTTGGGVPDPFHVCLAWSLATRRELGSAIRTGIGVIPAPRTWQPISLAAQAATVGLLSDGNFVLGIGSGGGAGADYLAQLGMPNRPIAVVREYVSALRSLLAGEEIGGGPLTVAPGRLYGDLVTVPIYIAALGPQMMRLAGSVADGVSLSWATPDHIAWSEARLDEGVAASGRDRSALVLSGYVRVCVDDDVDLARRALAKQFLSYGLSSPGGNGAMGVYRSHFGRMGFEEVLRGIEIRRDEGAGSDELADLVPDDVLRLVGYFGDASGAADRYAELSSGLDETIVRVIAARPGRDPVFETLDALLPTKIRSAPAFVG